MDRSQMLAMIFVWSQIRKRKRAPHWGRRSKRTGSQCSPSSASCCSYQTLLCTPSSLKPPPTRRPTPSQSSEPPPPGAFLPTFLASLIAPFLAASCAPPYLHINGTVPLDLCSYQSVGTLKERIPPKSLFHEKVVWESCCSWWEWSLATRERSISPAYFQTFQTFSSPLPPPPLCSKMRIVRNNPKKRVVTSKILTLPKLAWPPNP